MVVVGGGADAPQVDWNDVPILGSVVPKEKTMLYTTYSDAETAGGLGEQYSTSLADNPFTDGYATVGERGKGIYRIPSLTKTTLDDGTVRIIAAFDVRYRGTDQGNGDVGQGSVYGSDITVMYSDDKGTTWKTAVNKNTRKKPAIDVANAYGPAGQPEGVASSGVQLIADVCDPCLVVEKDGTIWCGMAGGAGFLGNDWTKSNFRIWKSEDNGETWEEDTNPADSYARKWLPIGGNATNRGMITNPGHGLLLEKDVPGSEMKAGMMVLPIQQSVRAGDCGIYLAYGADDPKNWTIGSTSNFTTRVVHSSASASEEGQICQLDDGSILLVSKSNGSKLNQYKNGQWSHITTDAFIGRKNCQTSLLKIAEGNGDDKCGVVAFCSPGNVGGTYVRGNITVGFARDLSGQPGAGADNPLDSNDRYYICVRTEQQNAFGYTDMVMIDDNTLGVLYESFSTTNDNVHGMRFIRIDVSDIITKLSQKPIIAE